VMILVMVVSIIITIVSQCKVIIQCVQYLVIAYWNNTLHYYQLKSLGVSHGGWDPWQP
jgi:hypothetical protein